MTTTIWRVTLLDTDLLRRDQVWFVDKGQDGSSQLYSLWDFKVRAERDLSRDYLEGRFGAVPILGEMNFGQT